VVKRQIRSRIPLAVLALFLGVTILIQFRARGRTSFVASDREAQALLLSELVEASSRLRAEIELLDAQLAAYETDGRGAGMQELVSELNRIKVLNGLIEVSGPGIELSIDGPLSAIDLQDLVNELRNAGAEAISLNGHRLVVTSVLTVETQGQIKVDGHLVVRPYLFQAIGDSHTLESALLRPGGLLYLQRRSYPSLAIAVTRRSRLVLVVHRPHESRHKVTTFQYAQPME
jgi:uncharacterized protein YlxW (UPF0749 family)